MSAFICLECGKKLSAKAAQRAMDNDGCPGCGGSDIDVAPVVPSAADAAKAIIAAANADKRAKIRQGVRF